MSTTTLARPAPAQTQPVPRPAAITASHGRRWWKCPGCEKTLAEVVGERVIVKVKDRRITLPLVTGMDQTCPHCGTVSEVGA